MEKEPNEQLTGELSIPQFRQKLNQLFEEHGVVDNLRSHLRSLMITALQQSEIYLKAHQKTSPKSQSIDLLVAEYLLKHGCHYTLSILMSELPCLANFGSGTVYLRCGPNTKSKPKYHFQEREVIEILNCLGVSSNVEIDYNQSKEESLLECLLRLLPKIQLEENCKKALEEENKTTDKEDYVKMVRELSEREKRIQEYLKRHREEMLEQLQIAEKNLDTRRETIEKEVTERQLHLGRIAFQWKDKHKEILALSKHFAALKTENKSLQARLDKVEAEMTQLKLEIQEKTGIIERLEAEKMFFKARIREYLKFTNKGTKDGDNISDQNNVLAHKENNFAIFLREKYENINSSGSAGDGFSLSDTSLTEEALLEKVKLRLHILEEETSRISDKYTKYKKKYTDDLSMKSDISNFLEESCSKTLNIKEDAGEKVQYENISKKEAAQQVNMDNYIQKLQEIPVKTKIIYTEEKTIPTKRQEQNHEYYLKSRQFLEVLEKSSGLIHCSSSSSTDISPCYSLSSESLKNLAKDAAVEEEKSTKESENFERCSGRKAEFHEERQNRDLTDKECLNLLQEATRSFLKSSESEQDEVQMNS